MAETTRRGQTPFSEPLKGGAERGQSAASSDPVQSAKEMAADAGEQLKITVEDQKRAGAHHVSQFARAVRTAADQLDGDTPELASYIRGAAGQVEEFSRTLRERDVKDLFQEVQGFARRQPAAFLGASILVGFGLARFLKSGSPTPRNDRAGSRYGGGHSAAGLESGSMTRPFSST